MSKVFLKNLLNVTHGLYYIISDQFIMCDGTKDENYLRGLYFQRLGRETIDDSTLNRCSGMSWYLHFMPKVQ